MPFQLNDSVRIVPGTLLEDTGELVPDWAGTIVEVPAPGDREQMYLVELDAPSLGRIPPKQHEQLLADEEPLTVYYFSAEDLEPAPRRDTPAERKEAQDRVADIYFGAEPELDLEAVRAWVEAFEQSPRFAALPERAQENGPLIVQMFADLAFGYEGAVLGEWSAADVLTVTTEWFPQKMNADADYFADIAPVLEAFFGFAGETGRIDNAAELANAARKAGPAIVRNAADPRYWGPAKQLMMGAADAGVDVQDEASLRAFLDSMIGKRLPEPQGPARRPAGGDPYRHLSRNDTIRVRYADGTEKEGKFKRLEADLRTGKCTLVG